VATATFIRILICFPQSMIAILVLCSRRGLMGGAGLLTPMSSFYVFILIGLPTVKWSSI